ncbi:MAG: hypothetical protein RQ729_02450 [Wenzhouxiangellaceae bacterium]|nr:hypothetical protein [Wenzhouxiangellaceae bacterium]
MKPPLLIEIDLLGSPEQSVAAHWLPLLASLNQADRPLVLLAARPARWTPTRNQVDRAFMRQATIEADLRRAGGALDAVVYLDFGLFVRKRQFERVLADLANRYNCSLGSIEAIVPKGRICETVRPLVGITVEVNDEAAFEQALREQIRRD